MNTKELIDDFLGLDKEIRSHYEMIDQIRKDMREFANKYLPELCPIVFATNQKEYDVMRYSPIETLSHSFRDVYLQKVEEKDGKLVVFVGFEKFDDGYIETDVDNIVNIESFLRDALQLIVNR